MIEMPRKLTGNLISRASSPPLAPSSSWRSRGYLPHFDATGAVQHIVFRLSDALPAATMAELQGKVPAQRFAAVIEALRAGHGARLLLPAEIAGIVENALLHFDAQRYRVIAWCVMPTHVHVLVEQMEGHSLSEIVRTWQSFTANNANKMLGRTGPFWAREYYDRSMRDAAQLETARTYIEYNPVAAGLCTAPEQWRFSSAWETPAGGRRYEWWAHKDSNLGPAD